MDIITLEPNHKRKAAAIVSSAFFHYPMFVHYFPDPKRRERWLPWYMEKTLNCAMRYGEAFITSDFSGVMFILPPGHTRLTNWEYIQNGFLFTPFVVGFRRYIQNNECEKIVADTHARLMNERDHYYLWGLVADKQMQRKGAGSALLRALIGKADAEKLPIYLETHDKNNVAYYGRSGFRLLHTEAISGHGLDIYCMSRDANA